MSYYGPNGRDDSSRTPRRSPDVSSSILGRPSATSAQYVDKPNAFSVSIHNRMEWQQWEKRQGADPKVLDPSAPRERSRSPPPCPGYRHDNHQRHQRANRDKSDNDSSSSSRHDNRSRAEHQQRPPSSHPSDHHSRLHENRVSERRPDEGYHGQLASCGSRDDTRGRPDYCTGRERHGGSGRDYGGGGGGGSSSSYPSSARSEPPHHHRHHRGGPSPPRRHSPSRSDGRREHHADDRASRPHDDNSNHRQEYGSARYNHSSGGGWEAVPRRNDRRHNHKHDDNNQHHQHPGRDIRLHNNHHRRALDPPPPFVTYIPPTSSNGTYTPFMLLLCGIPGSGKSTLANCLVQGKPWMYVRVNQDRLGNRHACEDMARSALARGKCPIIDRCNFDPKQRAPFLGIAESAKVEVDIIVFQYPMDACVARCQSRQHHETIAPSEAQSVVQRMIQQFSPPLPNRNNIESYRVVKTVTDVVSFNDVMVEFLNTNVL
jgi:predicted kinase